MVVAHNQVFREAWYDYSVVKLHPTAVDVSISGSSLHVVLADSRKLSAPLAWFPRLLDATPLQKSHWRLIGCGEGIHRPDVDEDVSVAGLLRLG
jgi:hypothetical protein